MPSVTPVSMSEDIRLLERVINDATLSFLNKYYPTAREYLVLVFEPNGCTLAREAALSGP